MLAGQFKRPILTRDLKSAILFAVGSHVIPNSMMSAPGELFAASMSKKKHKGCRPLEVIPEWVEKIESA